MNEKNIQQSANEFVTALVNSLGNGTVQEVVEKNIDEALDVSHVAVKLPRQEISPEVVKHLKDLTEIVKETSMDTRHDLGLAFPPSHFSSTDNPLMLFYKSIYDTVAYYTALIQATPEDRELLIRHYINGEPLTALAKAYGYANASGIRKRIERIKKQITEKFSA